jgi:hypothetical protein
VLDVITSVGRVLPVPITACRASALGAVGLSDCSVLVHDNNSTGGSVGAGSSFSFKAAVDPTCTLARVHSGLCSACTAAAATAGTCPPGTHTFIFHMSLPGGITTSNILAIVVHVGSCLLSAEVMLQFEVISDSRGLTGVASTAREVLQFMLVSSKV